MIVDYERGVFTDISPAEQAVAQCSEREPFENAASLFFCVYDHAMRCDGRVQELTMLHDEAPSRCGDLLAERQRLGAALRFASKLRVVYLAQVPDIAQLLKDTEEEV